MNLTTIKRHGMNLTTIKCATNSMLVKNLPPPLFAFFVWNGNEITLVQRVDQRSIGVKQETLHDQDVSLLLLLVVGLRKNVGIQGVINTVRLLKLHRVLFPGIDRAHHGVHVQSSDDIVLLIAIFTNFNLILGLEEVILVNHAAVGQVLDEPVGEGGLPSVGDPSDADNVLHGWLRSRKKAQGYKELIKPRKRSVHFQESVIRREESLKREGFRKRQLVESSIVLGEVKAGRGRSA